MVSRRPCRPPGSAPCSGPSDQELAARIHRLLGALAKIHRGRYCTAAFDGWTLGDEIVPALQMAQPLECDARPAVTLDPRPQGHVRDRIIPGDVLAGGELIVEHP